MRGFRAAAGIVALAAMAAGCGSTGGSARPSDTVSTSTTTAGDSCAADRAGGSVSFASFSEPRSMDTLLAGGGSTGSNELAAIYDVLVRYDPATGKFQPWLAESLEPNADSTAWTLKLRPNVRFSNGDPFTADAVKFSISRHQSVEGKSQNQSLASMISAMDIVDRLTVRFQLKGSWTGFPYVLGGPVGMIVNPNVVKTMNSDGFPKDAAGVGAGPYTLSKWTPAESIVLQARNDYWGGPVCVQQLRFVTLGGGDQAYQSLKGTGSDVAFLRTPTVIAQARADNTPIFGTLGGAGEILLLNSGIRGAKTPTADPRVRQAIAYAVDPKVVDTRSNDGKGFATSALIPEKSRFYQGLAGPSYDVAKAKTLLAQVMTQTGWDGTLRFECDNAPARQSEAIAVKTMLEAAGFKVQLSNTQTINAMLQKVIVDANFDLACFGFNVTDQSPWAKLARLLGTGSASNYAGYSNVAFDAALVQLRGAPDDQATKAALKQVQDIWNETVPAAILAASEEAIAWKSRVHGLTPTMEAVVLFSKAGVQQ